MKITQRVAAVCVGVIAVSVLSVPAAPTASATPKARPGGGPTSVTWTAPWATSPAPAPCTAIAIECASTTTAGDLRAFIGPLDAGAQGGYGNPRHERAASVLVSDAVGSGLTSRSYTATIVLHGSTASGAGYADLRARLNAVPMGCNGACVVAGGDMRVANSTMSLGGDVLITLTFRLEVESWSTLTALPAGTYSFAVGAVAGIADQDEHVYAPMPCMTDSCQLQGSVYEGIGSADLSATVQRVIR